MLSILIQLLSCDYYPVPGVVLKKKQSGKAWTGHKKIWLVTASVSLDEAPHGCRLQSPYLGKEFVLNAPEKAFQIAGYNILILIYK